MSPDYLYEKYYTVYRSDLLHRASQQGETLFSQAILDYEQGNLAKASIGFDSLILRDPGNQLVVFYRGLASLGNGDTDDAIRLFSTIPDSLNDPFNEHRRWYLSLALLAAEDIAGASEILKQISESKGYYAKKADRILRRLGS
jgi:predicted Zn-dependent protease